MTQIHSIAAGVAATLLCLAGGPAWAQAEKTEPQILFTNVEVWDGKSETLTGKTKVLAG